MHCYWPRVQTHSNNLDPQWSHSDATTRSILVDWQLPAHLHQYPHHTQGGGEVCWSIQMCTWKPRQWCGERGYSSRWFWKEILAQTINLFTEVIPATIVLTQNVMISVIVLLSVSSCVIVLGAVRIVARKSETSQYCSRSNTQVLILSKV